MDKDVERLIKEHLRRPMNISQIIREVTGDMKGKPIRDSAVIEPLLDSLDKALRGTDMRLGQVLINILREGEDLFYLENEEILRRIEARNNTYQRREY
jgi:hypothetical protein